MGHARYEDLDVTIGDQLVTPIGCLDSIGTIEFTTGLLKEQERYQERAFTDRGP